MNGPLHGNGATNLCVSCAALDCPTAPFLVADGAVSTFAEVAQRAAFLMDHFSLDSYRSRPTTGPVAFVSRSDVIPFALEGLRLQDQIVAVCALLQARAPFVVLHPRWTPREREWVLKQCGTERVLDARGVSVALASLGSGSGAGEPLESPCCCEQAADRSTQVLLYTSGTSGPPKGARLSQDALLAAAAASTQRLGWLAKDRWLLNLPLAHVGGLSVITRALCARGTVALAPEGRFEAQPFVDTIERLQVTMVSVVPTMLHRIVEAQLRCPSFLRFALVGGARAAAPLLSAARGLGWPCLTTYGLTEACSQVATQPLSAASGGCDALPPLRGVEVRIRGEDGLASSFGTGRVEIRGRSLFSGYLSEPQRSPSEWFSTGDWGVLENSGLQVLARRDDLLISGGENVSPGEVEAVLEEHPDVLQACVVGLADPEWGQRVAAILVRGDGELAVPVGFAAFVSDRLSAFKQPRQTLWVKRLPETPGGKLDRAACREQLLKP